MKIIHTADIHLDSPLSGVADGKTRRLDLLRALSKMSTYANNVGVSAIIVAGDLFDEQTATTQTIESVAQIIGASKAQWFVLQGNHGSSKPYDALKKLCPKVCLFANTWTRYDVGNVTIVGRELGVNDQAEWQNLTCDASRYNILVLHGDVDDDTYGLIDKKKIATLPIKYVALGHRHAFAEHKFGRVRGCYSGVLEARGFDETANSGFVLIDTDTDKIAFVPQSIRRIVTKQIDVSAVSTNVQLEQLIFDSVKDVDSDNYLNVEFVGSLQAGVNVKLMVDETLERRYFALRVCDKTTPSCDLNQLKDEVSLRGEFVRLALQLTDETERNEVLKLGLLALEGGDVS